MTRETLLVLSAVVSVGVLVLLIARWRVTAFLALAIAALCAGVSAGMPLLDVVRSFQEGMGAVLGSIAMVVALGAVLGKLLGESGGAEAIARTVTGWFGPARLPWAVLAISFVVGLPVFFAVGLVLLTPIVAAIARSGGVNFLSLALPMVAGLSVAHGLIPPHPGPILAVETLKADPGKTILYSILIGAPVAILAGPIFAKWACARWVGPVAPGVAAAKGPRVRFGAAVFTVTLPVLLMLVATVADLTLAKGSFARTVAGFVGSPLFALLASVLLAFWTFGARAGFDRGQLLKFSEECLGPTANILLIVGAGGGFNRVLVNSGVGNVLSDAAAATSVSPLILGWLIAAMIRIATGSATVAISAAAGILAPIAAAQNVNLELLVIAMGAGSLILSHLNDGGFWFVKEYLNLSVPETLRTWTVIETIIAVGGLAGAMILDWLL